MNKPSAPLPRFDLFGPSDYPTPDGFMNSREILDHLFELRWRTALCDLDIEIQGYPVSSTPRLADAASAGQILECVRAIHAACSAGELECVVPSNPQDPECGSYLRITPADWSSRDFDDWENDLLAGVVHRQESRALSSVEGKPLLFGFAQAEQWLRGLRSPHLLPEPLSANTSALPQRSYVTLSEAVSWLAYGESLDKDELSAKGASEMWRAQRYVEEEGGSEDAIEFALWFAAYLASLVRRERVRVLLHDAISRGELAATGRPQSLKGVGDLRSIPADEFLDGMNWRDTQFERHDLEWLWGGLDDGKRGKGADAESKGGRPVRNTAVLEAFDQLAPEGKTEGVTWRILAQRISKVVGWDVSSGALEAAVRRRSNTTKPTK